MKIQIQIENFRSAKPDLLTIESLPGERLVTITIEKPDANPEYTAKRTSAVIMLPEAEMLALAIEKAAANAAREES